jgi:exodeoxyribonuclease VII large subunit
MLGAYQNQLANAAGLLESLSPLAILKRGYAVAYSANGQIVDSVEGMQTKDQLDVRVQDGIINCVVQTTRKNA